MRRKRDMGQKAKGRPCLRATTHRQAANQKIRVKISPRERALTDLFWFTKNILGYTDLDEGFHRPICNILQDRPDRKDVGIWVARGHFKSSIGAIAYPIWRACQNPSWRFLIAMHIDEVAKMKQKEIMQHFEHNTRFRMLFPEILPDFGITQWSATYGATVRRPDMSGEPTFRSVGMGTGVTGTHPDEIIEDDLVAPQKDDMGREFMEPDPYDIRKAINWHKLSRSLIKLPDHGRYTTLGTTWCQDDYIHHLETSPERKLFSFYRMPAEDEHGNPTFKSRFSKQALYNLKLSQGEYLYSSQYLLQPMAPGDQLFFEDDFVAYDELPARDQMEIWAAVDPASSDAAHSHPTAIVVIGVDKFGYRYVLDALRSKKGDYAEIIDWIFEHNDKWNGIDHWLVESVAAQVWLVQMLQREQMLPHRTPLYDIQPVTRGPREHKDARIRASARDIKAKAVKFPRDPERCSALRFELLNFPRTAAKDTADAFATALAAVWQALPSQQQATDDKGEPVEYWRSADWILGNARKRKGAPFGFDRQLAGTDLAIFR